MWFKQLSLFRLNLSALPDLEALAAGMEKHGFAPPSGLEWYSKGFVAPASHAPDRLLHPLAGGALAALKREDKVLPAATIRDELDDWIADIESREARKVGRKEKRELKDHITDDLLPKAMTKTSRNRALLDVQAGWIMVDAAGQKAESLVSALREALPPFPARLPRTLLSPGSAMTLWITGTLPDGFELDCDAVMRSPGDDGATVRCSRQDLTAREVQEHIETGKVVTQLGLVWQQRIRFVLTDKLELKRLQFLDVLQEQASQAGDDAPSLFDATAVLMLGELRELVADLIAALGGEAEQ